MAKFDVGDKVRIRTSGKTGTVKVIYDGNYWNMSDSEYGIEFDDGSGTITIIERVIDLADGEPRCECGVGAVGGGKHSEYCPLYDRDA